MSRVVRLLRGAIEFLGAGFVLLSFAGCIENPTSAEGDDPTEPSSVEETVPGKGSVKGQVTDDEQIPIAGAEAAILNVDAERRLFTDAAGGFVFTGLEPGSYEVAVQKLGFVPSSRLVEVGEGEAASVTFQLERLPDVSKAYYTIILGEGYIACGAYILGVLTITNANICPWDANHKPRFPFEAPQAELAGILQEVVWQKNHALSANQLSVSLAYKPTCTPFCDAEETLAEEESASPVRLYTDMKDHRFPEEPVNLVSWVFVGGDGQELAVVYQQTMTHYITLFYVVGGDPETFTAIPP